VEAVEVEAGRAATTRATTPSRPRRFRRRPAEGPATSDASAAAAARPAAAGTRLGAAALLVLCAVYALLAALPAARGSNLVLGTEGGSPDWLLGPLRFAGLDAADGPLAGPLFYAGLWLALLLYALVLLRAADLSRRVALIAIVSLHLLFLIAPPLLSQDVFSYIAYSRMGVDNDLNPYGSTPLDIADDEIFPFAGSKDAVSVYGPLFTLTTYALAPLGLAASLWALKAVAALASLGVVMAVWRAAERLGRDPVLPGLVVGLNPLVLVHVVGGAHNEALVVLATTVGVLAFVAGRERAGVALATAATGIKASAGLVVPFLVAGARRRVGAALAALGVAAAVALVALLAFGPDALDALGLISSNQERTSRFSFPYKAAELLGLVLPGDRLDYRDGARLAFALGFGLVATWLLVRTWRGADPLTMAGWATLALLLASAWLVPWYALWLLPLAALSSDRRLLPAAVVLCAWMLAIAVPL
jgi:alpha-1,6-mannosyltransferase